MARTLRHGIRFVSVLSLLVLPTLADGCCTPDQNTPADGLAPEITAKDALALIQGDPNVVVLDVRTPIGFALVHTENAINLCLLCSKSFMEELDPFDRKAVYVVCGSKTDDRSTRATDTMVEMDFETVYNMVGGIEEWTSAGYPIVQQ